MGAVIPLADLAGVVPQAILAVAEAARRDPAVALAAAERRHERATWREIEDAAETWARWRRIAEIRRRNGKPVQGADDAARAALLRLAVVLPPEVWTQVGELERVMLGAME